MAAERDKNKEGGGEDEEGQKVVSEGVLSQLSKQKRTNMKKRVKQTEKM